MTETHNATLAPQASPGLEAEAFRQRVKELLLQVNFSKMVDWFDQKYTGMNGEAKRAWLMSPTSEAWYCTRLMVALHAWRWMTETQIRPLKLALAEASNRLAVAEARAASRDHWKAQVASLHSLLENAHERAARLAAELEMRHDGFKVLANQIKELQAKLARKHTKTKEH